MEKASFAMQVIDILCNYAGDDKVFEAFIKRWGVEELYEILVELLEKKKELENN